MSVKKRVLIVEDDLSQMDFISNLMRNLGFDVRSSPTAEEAFTSINIAESPFDLVLLDMQLPGEDGLSVLKRIRSKYPNAKVIVITSYPEEYAEACKKGQVDGYLKKPVALVELTQRIEEIFKAKGSTFVEPTEIVKPLDRRGQIAAARILFLSSIYKYSYLNGMIPTIENEEMIGKPCYGWYDVTQVHDTQTAMEVLKEKQIDLLIATSDVHSSPSLTGRTFSPSDLIMEVVHSNYGPKEILFVACFQEDEARKELEDLKKRGFHPSSMYQIPYREPLDIHTQEDMRLLENAVQSATLKIASAIEEACFHHRLTLPNEEVKRRFKQQGKPSWLTQEGVKATWRRL